MTPPDLLSFAVDDPDAAPPKGGTGINKHDPPSIRLFLSHSHDAAGEEDGVVVEVLAAGAAAGALPQPPPMVCAFHNCVLGKSITWVVMCCAPRESWWSNVKWGGRWGKDDVDDVVAQG